MNSTVRILATFGSAAAALAVLHGQAPQPTQPAQSSPTEVEIAIRGEAGAPPHYAVPDFIPLAFEREYDMIPRDPYRTIEQTPNADTINFDRWRELGADGVVKGSVRRTGNTFQVEMRRDIRKALRPSLRQLANSAEEGAFSRSTGE